VHSDYLGSFESVLSRKSDIFFLGNADNMAQELTRFSAALGVSDEIVLNPVEEKHFKTRYSDEISDEARKYLEYMLHDDIKYFEALSCLDGVQTDASS